MTSHKNGNHDEKENEIVMTVGPFYSWVYQPALCQASSNTVHPFFSWKTNQSKYASVIGGEIKIRLISTSLINET